MEEAYFHVTQFRGFEKFCEGRPFSEMPSLMARICGICPVSHLIASAKACDAILAVRIPENAARLRRILNLAQIVQSHALSFFYLSSPDLLLGMDSDPATRNVFGVMEANPALARDGVRLRQFGQQIIERLAGKRIHPAWVVPGGVNEPLTAEHRDAGFWRGFRRLWPSRGARSTGSRPRSSASAKKSACSPISPPCSWAWWARTATSTITTASCAFWMPAATSSPMASTVGVCQPHRRDRAPVDLSQDRLLQAAGLPRRHLPRGAAGAPQCGRRHRHPARQPGVGRVPRAGPRRRAQLVLLPLRPADRDPLRAGKDRAVAQRAATFSTRTCGPTPAPTTPRAWAFPKRRAAR